MTWFHHQRKIFFKNAVIFPLNISLPSTFFNSVQITHFYWADIENSCSTSTIHRQAIHSHPGIDIDVRIDVRIDIDVGIDIDRNQGSMVRILCQPNCPFGPHERYFMYEIYIILFMI